MLFLDFLVFTGIAIAWLTLMAILIKNMYRSMKMKKGAETVITFGIIVFVFILSRYVNAWLLQCSYHQELGQYACAQILLNH